MGLETIPILVALVVPLLAVAALSATETALFSLTYHDRLRLKRMSPRAGSAVAYLMGRPRAMLILVLFLNMLSATVYFVLTSLALMASTHALVALAIGVCNLLLMTLVGEIVSKVLAAHYRVEVSRVVAPVLLAAFRTFQPAVIFLEKSLIGPLARLVASDGETERLTEEELDALLHLGTREGAIDADERRVLQQVIRLSGLRVRDVMTPRVDMHYLDEQSEHAEVVALAREHHLTRVPVCRGGVGLDDEVVGMLNMKQYLGVAAWGAKGAGEGRAVPIAQCLEPAQYVPASATLDKLLEVLRGTGGVGGGILALVVDEHGSITGVISTQDVVQRLIVELARDEDAEQEAQVQQVGVGEWSVPGRLSVREWEAMFGRGVGGRGTHGGAGIDGRFGARVSTVAGLIFAQLGRVPRVGDVVTIGNVRLLVEGLDGRVVERARLSLMDGRRSATGQGGAG